ncbi:hypothetical protein Bca4012_002869 [Brassica carinata]
MCFTEVHAKFGCPFISRSCRYVYILNVFCGLSINKNRAPAMKKNHRAMDDIRESIKELKYYKETIFKANKARR